MKNNITTIREKKVIVLIESQNVTETKVLRM